MLVLIKPAMAWFFTLMPIAAILILCITGHQKEIDNETVVGSVLSFFIGLFLLSLQ